MLEYSKLIFLTLVVSCFLVIHPTFSWAAPIENKKPSILKEQIQNVGDPSLAASAAQNRKNDQIVQLNFAMLNGKITKKQDASSFSAYGFTYDWRDFDQNYWSVSAKWLSSKNAWLEAGKKFMIFRDYLSEPYYKLSISHFADPDDSLAGLSQINSFKFSVSMGLLDWWTLGRILNVECGLHWGIPGLAAHLQFGAQWSF
jgi:hypothetical protein